MADDESSGRTHPPPFDERLAAAAEREDLWAWEVVRDRDLLEDFAHDALAEALKHVREHPSALQGPGQLEAWLRKAGRRLALNHVKARDMQARAIARAHVELDAQRRVAHEKMNPSGALLEWELAWEIAVVLDGMRPHLREAWRLYSHGDIPAADAAARMGVTKETYIRYVVMANRILRDALRHHRYYGLHRNESTPPAAPVRNPLTD
jgi:DNA-directed RNA polymerase specialized sigma24 family protein